MPIELDFEAEHWKRFLDTAGLNLASTDSRINNAKKNLSFFSLQYLSLWALLLLVTTGPVLLSFVIAQTAIWVFAYTADCMEFRLMYVELFFFLFFGFVRKQTIFIFFVVFCRYFCSNVQLRGWARQAAMYVQFILLCCVSVYFGVTWQHAFILVALTLLVWAHAALKMSPPKPVRARGRGRRAAEVSESEESG
jgi:hypothetical protein